MAASSTRGMGEAEEAKQQQSPALPGASASTEDFNDEMDWEAVLMEPPSTTSHTPSYLFFGGYVAACILSLVGGVAVGYQSFDASDAQEALERQPKPSVSSEKLAMRTAVRAFGWGTAVCIGTGVLTVLGVRNILQLRSVEDFGRAVHKALLPFDRWLQAKGDWLKAVGNKRNLLPNTSPRLPSSDEQQGEA